MNVRSNLSDISKCARGNGTYISLITSVSLCEYITYRSEYCRRCHQNSCIECPSLTRVAADILEKGIVKVSEIFKSHFPSSKYQSDKAIRRLMQLPVVIFKHEHLFVTEQRADVDFERMVRWVKKIVPENVDVEKKLNKETLKSLCDLASSESDRKIIKAVATWNMSAKKVKETYGIDDHNRKTQQVREAMALADDINETVTALAKLQDKVLLQSMGIVDGSLSDSDSCDSESEVEVLVSDSVDEGNLSAQFIDEATCPIPKDSHSVHTPNEHPEPGSPIPPNSLPSSETLFSWLRENKLNWFSFYSDVEQHMKYCSTEVLDRLLLEFTEYLNDTEMIKLTEEEGRAVAISRQAFEKHTLQQPLLIEGEEVVSESDDETPGPQAIQNLPVNSDERKKQIRSARRSIKQKAKRNAAKLRASKNLLKRKVSSRVSRIIQQHPTVGKDIEDFVKSKKVGADAWRRTGVLTFGGTHRRGKKVTYKRIQEHLQAKYESKISYGTVVQLCVVRSKRRISAKRYKGVAQVTCRKSRKGFSVKLNPDAHWSSAFYKGLDAIQGLDGRDKIMLNRDDQAGFRLDTTFTHRQGKCITTVDSPSLTTRTDFVNPYQSVLQTTSYLFMESESTAKACVGVVKPHYLFPKCPTQHYVDLNMLEDKFPNHLVGKNVECIRVDGATDEGPGHLEVQFLWTERHILKQRICTMITSRHSGGSYLNEVELMNGCIAQAHSNLYIPSTLLGSNYDANGLNKERLTENLEAAVDVYIDRVDGAPCCSTELHMFKGGQDVALQERRTKLLTFLRGNAAEKRQLRETNQEQYKYFQDVWTVRERHMNHNLPENYVFMLNLCHKADCIHPLCGKEVGESSWYVDGPPLEYVPVPIPDPSRPWGGECGDCVGFCAGHYLKPDDHKDFVKINGTSQCMFKPPRVVIKEAFYNIVKNDQIVTDKHREDVARQSLLSIEELKMHVEHLALTAKRRKEGAKKAASTRAKKRNAPIDESVHVWCWCREGECGDMIHCEGKSCPIQWFHLKCVGLMFFPACVWFCPDCKVEPEQYCLCNQGEYGLMLACDDPNCAIGWFHLACVGLKAAPRRKWICPRCKPGVSA